jgi:2-methylisocitrate lyase-like PEP mutase family enzyme
MLANPGRKYRDLLSTSDVIVAPGVYDGLSARIVEDLGFPAASVGGWITGAHLCTTEPLTTLTEQVAVAHAVARAVRIPIIADAHTGYGEAPHVVRTVREFERAGLAGIHLEDQYFPKRVSYHRGVKEFVPINQMLVTLRAALDARESPDFIIVARTDAWQGIGGSLDEAIRRLCAYAEAGADMLLPLVYDAEQARRVREEVPGIPMMFLAGIGAEGGDELTVKQIADMGYQVIHYPLNSLLAGAGAMRQVLSSILEDGIINHPDYDKEQEMVERLIGLPEYYEIEDRALAAAAATRTGPA